MIELKIKEIYAREILDSRGNPTISAEVELENGVVGEAKVPSGASTGAYEVLELRDKDNSRYLGRGVMSAVENVHYVIAPKLKGMNIYDQRLIDQTLIKLDGTENKSTLGGNSILAVSMACVIAAANSLNMPLYKYLGGINGCVMPVPMMNIINGGKHAENKINIQEFMLVPNAKSFKEALRMCTEVYHTLKKVLKEKELSTGLGDEGGFAPNLQSDEEALQLIIEAINKAGYIEGTDFKLALDVAASEMKEEAKKIGEDAYYFWKAKKLYKTEELINYYNDLIEKYPIVSIEDGLGEDDIEGWIEITKKLGDKITLVGDDLFVTNSVRLKKGIDLNMANAILIKLNQIGTISETLDTIRLAKEAGYKVIISHRSGETEDTTIADLAVAVNSMLIKTGAPARTDRVCKYNRLLKIEG